MRSVATVIRHGSPVLLVALALAGWSTDASGQIRATARSGAVPAWNQGAQQVTTESYYHAIECGKQGGDDPACLFWDTGLCENDDFTLAAFSGYKQVAYQVWGAVRAGQPAPQPNFQAARRTRFTISFTPKPGSDTELDSFTLKRGGQDVRPVDRSYAGPGGQFTYDYAAWSPNASVTLDIVGTARTLTCVIEPSVLQTFR